MKKYLTEFIGTFFLVLTVVLTANNPGIAPMAPLAIGSILMVMIFAGGHISGGHYNPAVTLAVLIRGKIDRGDALYYMLVQVIAGVVAAAIGTYLHSCSGGAIIGSRLNEQPICAVLAEFLGTFALAYVVLNVATTRSNAGNSHYGLAIGFTVMSAAYAFGGLSGGAFNPAVAIGAAVAGMFSWGDIWIYLIGTLLGGAAAATAFHATYGKAD
ncbi:MAG: MIP/aquaporin family protein [Saprospiraceae bacterium]